MPHSHIPLCLTSHFMCVQSFHMVSIDVPASVGAPPLDTTSLAKLIPLDLTLHKIFFVKE